MESPFTAAGRVEQQVQDLARKVDSKAETYELDRVKGDVDRAESELANLRSSLGYLEDRIHQLENERERCV